MKRKIEIVVELAQRIKGGPEPQIVEAVSRQNPWFRGSEIAEAVGAICHDMLNPERLGEWMAHYPTLPVGTPQNVLIVMAGNIPLVGFFDMLCAFMAGHNAYVKCSSKDRVLMEWVISVIKEIEPSAPIYISEITNPDRVIATGGDGAVKHFGALYANVPTILRGARHSIAVLSGAEGEAESLVEDIYMYSGLGCRNVSMIFVPKGYSLCIPPYDTHPKYRSNYLQQRALLTMQGVKFYDNGSSLFVNSSEISSALSIISVCEYEDIGEPREWIESHDSQIQCIVSSIIDHPWSVDFGQAQHPTLFDYADDIDTMKFLTQ
ncbi:MAG: acyl-CoA reductase [Rikenellaceae bacterium]